MSRSPVERLLDGVAWTAVPGPAPAPGDNPDGLPYATHTGTLEIGGLRLEVAQLSDGRRVFLADSLLAAFLGDVEPL